MATKGESLKENLATYKEQLSQVEAALTVEPESEQLQKLQTDLQEVITLTQELISQNSANSSDTPASTSAEPVKAWVAGDKCMAIWSNDGGYYPATVDEILEDGTCNVIFEGYNQSEVTQVNSLNIYDHVRAKETLNRRDKAAAEREYKKKKNLKKKQRMQQLNEEREGEKSKWQSFNAKVFSKTSKGKVKKSIFATSEHDKGKVGVGTCGISGKPMTHYSTVPKYRKGM